MKFVVFVVFVVLAMAHAKYLMAPYELTEVFENNEIGGNLVQSATQEETLYIPMAHYMSCSQSGCSAVCHALGYRHGTCINDFTCKCYN